MKLSTPLNQASTKDNSGFTLLEALIGVFVFSIGVLATMSMQSSSLNANMLARQTTEASAVAASVLENLHPLNYTQAAELANGDNALPDIDNYAITYIIQRDAILEGTMLIQVTVTWTVNGAQKTVTLVGAKPDII
ncbi:MAG: hypothetical protein HKP58_19085 [Desulfatitalea sp.]|nr:prepilin-type N-terminal cleavage/methylation domain-containing protein [Desulfatitalea sp.]NNK02521.1 hypothetical protein [Desulfatitalea sp.]